MLNSQWPILDQDTQDSQDLKLCAYFLTLCLCAYLPFAPLQLFLTFIHLFFQFYYWLWAILS